MTLPFTASYRRQSYMPWGQGGEEAGGTILIKKGTKETRPYGEHIWTGEILGEGLQEGCRVIPSASNKGLFMPQVTQALKWWVHFCLVKASKGNKGSRRKQNKFPSNNSVRHSELSIQDKMPSVGCLLGIWNCWQSKTPEAKLGIHTASLCLECLLSSRHTVPHCAFPTCSCTQNAPMILFLLSE